MSAWRCWFPLKLIKRHKWGIVLTNCTKKHDWWKPPGGKGGRKKDDPFFPSTWRQCDQCELVLTWFCTPAMFKVSISPEYGCITYIADIQMRVNGLWLNEAVFGDNLATAAVLSVHQNMWGRMSGSSSLHVQILLNPDKHIATCSEWPPQCYACPGDPWPGNEENVCKK